MVDNQVAVLRHHWIEAADQVVEKGYLTERDLPEMMDPNWAAELVPKVNRELALRSLRRRVIGEKFQYYQGAGYIIYNPNVIKSADRAKQILQDKLGYEK